MTENMETFVYKDKKKLRCGYTTGTCAALAAKAAVKKLLSGICVPAEEILTPKGQVVRAEIEQWTCGNAGDFAECAVRKDGGDDYDVTDGLLIFVRAEFFGDRQPESRQNVPADWRAGGDRAAASSRVFIEGGQGVGRVTRAGLNQPVGAAAINSVPRRMMTEEVLKLLEEAGEERAVLLTVSVPGGEEAAKKTFNPVLGIEGGISILGTSGIVEPMSEEALVDTIRAHMQVLRAEGRKWLVLVPGNMGAGFLRRYMGIHGGADEAFFSSIVTCSNFIGKSVDLAGELGFSGLLLAGHMGKLVKLGNGIMNTHSREADGRMDTLISCALTAGADRAGLLRIQGSNTTEEALKVLSELGCLKETVSELLRRMDWYLNRRAMDGLSCGVLLFGTDGEVLGKTARAEIILEAAKNEGKVGEA